MRARSNFAERRRGAAVECVLLLLCLLSCLLLMVLLLLVLLPVRGLLRQIYKTPFRICEHRPLHGGREE